VIKLHHIQAVGKIALATTLVGGIVVVAAKDIAPHISMWWALLIFAGIVLTVVILIIFASILQGQINQHVLRKGGTDVQWLWFPGDKNPPGLQQLLDEKDAETARLVRGDNNDRHSL